MSNLESERGDHVEARRVVRELFEGRVTSFGEHPAFVSHPSEGADLIDEHLTGHLALDADSSAWFLAADVNFRAGRHDRSREFVLRGFDRIDAGVDPGVIADGYLTLGLLDASTHQWAAAVESWEQGLKLLPPHCEREIRLRTLLGEACDTLGRPSRAVDHLQEGLKVAALRENTVAECALLCRLGRHRHVHGDFDGASACFLHAMTRAAEDSESASEAAARIGYGAVCIDLTEYAEAEQALHDGLDAARTIEDRFLQLSALDRVAELHERTDDYDRARRALEEAVFLANGIEDPVIRGSLRHRLGMLHDSYGKDALAETAYRLAIDDRRSANDFPGLGATLNNLGSLYHRREAFDDARQSYREALLAFDECAHDRQEVDIVLDNLRRLQDHPRYETDIDEPARQNES